MSPRTTEAPQDPEELDEPLDLEEEEDDEPELSPELAARRSAALAHVRKYGDPVLKTQARTVDRFDEALAEQIRRMGELMTDAIGVGLAANQVGVLNRVLVYRVQQQAPVAALINPEIEWRGDEEEMLEEGCLSLPGVHVDVERPIHIRVRAQDEQGETVTVEASGLEARVIQHEMDHLEGKLVFDRISRGAAQGGHEGHARGAAGLSRPGADRLPRNLRVRGCGPAGPGRLRPSPGARRHPPRPSPRAGPSPRPAARGRDRP